LSSTGKKPVHRVFRAYLLFFDSSANRPASDLDSYVARALKTFDVPAFLSLSSKTASRRGKGLWRWQTRRSRGCDENTLFGIGSNTKAFTTAALASLVDAHIISWDDPVYQRLPGFRCTTRMSPTK